VNKVHRATPSLPRLPLQPLKRLRSLSMLKFEVQAEFQGAEAGAVVGHDSSLSTMLLRPSVMFNCCS
jgi:hypothetical protein